MKTTRVAKQICDSLSKISDELDGLRYDVELLQDAEQEKFDAMTEKAQESERGEKRQALIQALEDLSSQIMDSYDALSGIDAGAFDELQ